MITPDIKGLNELRAALTDFSERRLNAAVATALTRTAVKVKNEMAQKVEQAFDRPTPYTMRQLRYVPASADRLVSAVGFGIVAVTDDRGEVMRYQDMGTDTPAAKYMAPHIDGGPRRPKRLEQALQALGALPKGWVTVPADGAPLDGFGNVSRAAVVQILSQLRVQLVSGTDRNMSGDARKQIAAQRRAGGRYFVVPVGGKGRPGIFQREFVGRNITPVFWFASEARYTKKFDFQKDANELAVAMLPAEISKAVAEAAARLAAKGAA